VLAGKDIGGRAAGEEVVDHLRRDFRRVQADAGARQAVIGGEDGQARATQAGRQALLDQADL